MASDDLKFFSYREEAMLIGCGGTGSIVGRLLPHYLTKGTAFLSSELLPWNTCRFRGNSIYKGTKRKYILVDGDHVDRHNTDRQFGSSYIGRRKSGILRSIVEADGLADNVVLDSWNVYITKQILSGYFSASIQDMEEERGSPYKGVVFRIIVSCVDNNNARKAIEESIAEDTTDTLHLLIDVGNADVFGQSCAYLSYRGNRIGDKVSSYFPEILQVDEVLNPERLEQTRRCGEVDEQGFNQTLVANNMAANLAILTLDRFLRKKELITQAGFDIENSKVTCAYTTPVNLCETMTETEESLWLLQIMHDLGRKI
jgi:hypothetical protein